VSWIFIAPSVSPKRTSGGSNNPGLRLYKFDTDTGQVSSALVKDTMLLISSLGHLLSYLE
jgi:hypothetical protein